MLNRHLILDAVAMKITEITYIGDNMCRYVCKACSRE
jgi:hypothetical protein